MSELLNKYKTYIIIILSFILYTCSPSTRKVKNNIENKLINQEIHSSDNSEKSVYSISSPLQLINKLKKNRLNFDINILNPYENYRYYTTSYKMALNFGIYAADLAYLNSFNQLPESLKYFGTLKYLSEKLDLTAFLEPNNLKKIEQNIANNDSLFYLLALSLKSINYNLELNKRGKTACLILTGGWIESLHFLLNNSQTKPDSLTNKLLASQKYSAENIIKILSRYNSDSKGYKQLLNNLKQISITYTQVIDTYKYEEPTIDIKNKLTIINSSSTYYMNDSTMNELKDKVEELRALIISD